MLDKRSSAVPFPLFIVLFFSLEVHGIINGTVAEPGRYPFMVSLQWNNRHKCGGALIDKDTVLSVAHCIRLLYVDRSQMHRATVLLGSLNQKRPDSGSLRVPISHYITHPSIPLGREWKDADFVRVNGGMLQDYVLLKLAFPVNETAQIQFGRLAATNMPRISDVCTILGWGRFQHPDTSEWHANLFPEKLREGRMKVVGSDRTFGERHPYSSDTIRQYIFILAPMFNNGRSRGMPCFGDSGSPVVCTDSNGTYVGGLLEAASIPCNYPKGYSLAMRVNVVSDWATKTHTSIRKRSQYPQFSYQMLLFILAPLIAFFILLIIVI